MPHASQAATPTGFSSVHDAQAQTPEGGTGVATAVSTTGGETGAAATGEAATGLGSVTGARPAGGVWEDMEKYGLESKVPKFKIQETHPNCNTTYRR